MKPGWRSNYIRYKSYFLNVIGRYRERADIRVYLEILLSLVTISTFSIFALRPTLLTIAELLREIQGKQETIKQMEEKIQKLSQAQMIFDREKPKISLLKSAIPERPMPEVFARQVLGLSLKHQIQLSGLSTGEAVILGRQSAGSQNEPVTTPAPETYDRLSFFVNVNVPNEQYVNFASFLLDFMNMRYPAKLDLLTVTTRKDVDKKFLIVTLEGTLPNY